MIITSSLKVLQMASGPIAIGWLLLKSDWVGLGADELEYSGYTWNTILIILVSRSLI